MSDLSLHQIRRAFRRLNLLVHVTVSGWYANRVVDTLTASRACGCVPIEDVERRQSGLNYASENSRVSRCACHRTSRRWVWGRRTPLQGPAGSCLHRTSHRTLGSPPEGRQSPTYLVRFGSGRCDRSCLFGVALQRRPLPSRAILPGVSKAIQIFGVRHFYQFALTVAKENIAFAAAQRDAPAGVDARQTGHRHRR
jgi:hypothetical protein